MYERILIPLDGSTLAEQALPLAKMFAARFKATVILFQALPLIREPLQVEGEVFQVDEALELLRGQGRGSLESVRKDFAGAGITVECEVRVGAPATAILEYAEGARIDLITMTTHGRTGLQRWVYGSIADKVLHGARVPLLLVRARNEPAAAKPPTRILVPLDGSASAERALEPARQVAEAFDAELLLFRVWEFPPVGYDNLPVSIFDQIEETSRAIAQAYIAQKTSELQALGVRVGGETQSGAPVEGILGMAGSADASLIVMSTHGRSGISRWVMGSVADGVLRAAPVPVLLIRAFHPAVK